jgi:hypothetical protein
MNVKQGDKQAWPGRLIFTVPAYGFVMALYLDWLCGSTNSGIRGSARRAPSKHPQPAARVQFGQGIPEGLPCES